MSDNPPTVGVREVTAVPPADTQNLTQDELMIVVRAAMPAAVVGLALLAALYTMYFAAELGRKPINGIPMSRRV